MKNNLYPDLLQVYAEFEKLNIEIVPTRFRKQTALSHPDGLTAIDYSKLDDSSEELAVLLHELGHYFRGFYSLECDIMCRAQVEDRAVRAVYERFYPPILLQTLMQQGCVECWQLAEHLNLPEEFVHDMLHYYREIRGISF